MAALAAGGHRALFVGGCVRNALMGLAPGDIDIATDARPEAVMAAAAAAGLPAHPTGIAHGTVTLVAAGTAHEVTTFRRDVETDGRRAVVAFSDAEAEDAHRRDFTMNALYATAEGEVLDPLGTGLADLAARRIRFIDRAEDRIREDYLRILRFFRFYAWYGTGAPDAEAMAASRALAGGLALLSGERVWAETKKLLSAERPARALAAMAETGVLARVMPGAEPAGLPPLLAVEPEPAPLRRIVALGGSVALLPLSRAEARHLDDIAAALAETRGAAVRAARFGAEAATDAGLIDAARGGPPLDRGEIARGAVATFPVAAADLMPPLAPGPALGSALDRLREAWFESALRADRATLLDSRRSGENGQDP
ncbi:MAG: CCA tRNA nucleotidyltransferase [Pseudomonadota bacterium]